MIKAIIFDMDGVIIDSEPDHLKVEQKILKAMGINITEEEHSTYIGTTSYFMWEDLRIKYNLPKTLEELVLEDRNTYFDHLSNSQDLKAIDGVEKLIKGLYENGMKLAVASSSPIRVINVVINKLKLDKYFHEIVSGDFVEKSKPEPDIFLYAAEKLGVKPEECIVIEDSCNGAIAAKRANMKCVGYINKNSGNQDLSCTNTCIDSFHKLNVKELINT